MKYQLIEVNTTELHEPPSSVFHIVDTSTQYNSVVCECYDKSIAEKVCEFLNHEYHGPCPTCGI